MSSVRNATLLYEEIPTVSETSAIRSGFDLYGNGVTAVIGTGYSSMTKALSPVLDAYNIPMCDGASTSPALSDRSNYHNFFRPVPQDNHQAFAIVAFLQSQGWTEIAIIASQDSYGQNLANEVSSLCRNASIAINVRDQFYIGQSDFSRVLANIRDSLAKIIVFCGNSAELIGLAKEGQAFGLFGKGYAWITSDGSKYGLDAFTSDQLSIIDGVLNVFPSEGDGPIYEAFRDSFSQADKTRFPSSSKPIQPYLLFYVNCLESFVFGYDRILRSNPNAVFGKGTSGVSGYQYRIPSDFNFPDRDTVTGPTTGVLFSNSLVCTFLALSYYPLALTGLPADWKCVAEYQVYRIFTHKYLSNDVSMGNLNVILQAAGIILLDMAISIAWTAYDAPKVQWILFRTGQFYEIQPVCTSSSARIQRIFLYTEYAFHSALLVIGIILSALIMELPREYNTPAPPPEVGFMSGVESDDESSEDSTFAEVRMIKRFFPTSEVCYLKERTGLGVIIWTPRIIAISEFDNLIFLFASRNSIHNVVLFSPDWTVATGPEDRRAGAGGRDQEAYHSIKLVPEPEFGGSLAAVTEFEADKAENVTCGGLGSKPAQFEMLILFPKRLKCRGPQGMWAIGESLTPSSTVGELKREIEVKANIPYNRIKPHQKLVKAGYPPKVIGTNDDSSLSECGVRDGEQLQVEEDATVVTPPPAPPVTDSTMDFLSVAVADSDASNTAEAVKLDEGFVVVRPMDDDNSCLFHAIGYIFERDANVSDKLRQVVAAAIMDDPFSYNEVVLGRSVLDYAAWIQSVDSWGGAIELAIFSDHFDAEICSIDVGTLRVDRFGEGKGKERVAIVLYSGIHYDAIAMAPLADAPPEFDVTLFESGVQAETVVEAALKLAKIWKEKKKYTDVANFTIKCDICERGLKGQKEAHQHAAQTGHMSFSEYK
ncbi:ubiquitin-specific protease otu1 [Phlyctochytrium bullatum]|nr:ubiquitin-specific protease otu1 [Phlyctochytrium bullatum]